MFLQSRENIKARLTTILYNCQDINLDSNDHLPRKFGPIFLSTLLWCDKKNDHNFKDIKLYARLSLKSLEISQILLDVV